MEIDIEQIRNLGEINRNLLNTWADSCSILLDNGSHKPPVDFKIAGALKKSTTLRWKSIKNRNGYEDLAQTAEFAGYGMAILILSKVKNLIPSTRRAKGDGIDIVCRKDITDSENFLEALPEDFLIECKGSKNKSAVSIHLEAGKKQSAKAIGKVYVISTEFETPAALTHFRK